MSVELRVPPVGESITEVAVGEWLKAEGDYVGVDEAVVVVETDKVNLDVPAPVAGRITRVFKAKGELARVGDVLAEIEPGTAPEAASETAAEAASETAAKAASGTPLGEPKAATSSANEPRVMPSAASVMPSAARVMPSAARVLALGGLDASAATATGPGGRVLKEDAVRAVQAKLAPPVPESAPSGDFRQEERVPMTPLRQTVARRLVEAQQAAALLTTFNEVDMTAVLALRVEHKESFEARYGVKLGFMAFFVKAVVDALRAFPAINAEIRGTDIVYRNYYDIGIAVGGGKGLVVPILRNAERMSFADVEKQIAEYGRRAKDNKLKLAELQGGTFSISNGGVYGSLLSTPIVNPPQSGILGMHAIQDRPMAVQGQVVVRPMMYLALTYDHRLVDGREAVGFLKRIKACIEAPVRLLLEV